MADHGCCAMTALFCAVFVGRDSAVGVVAGNQLKVSRAPRRGALNSGVAVVTNSWHCFQQLCMAKVACQAALNSKGSELAIEIWTFAR